MLETFIHSQVLFYTNAVIGEGCHLRIVITELRLLRYLAEVKMQPLQQSLFFELEFYLLL